MQIMKRLNQFATTLTLLGISTAALAHPGHGVHGFGAGIAHPFTGLDHLLAMFAVGLWAAQPHQRRGAVWGLPATFMLALAAGAALAMSHITIGALAPWLEHGIATSVLALGLLIALAVRVPVALSTLVTAVFGAAHGYAHGLELPSAAAPLLYACGFLIATASLHLTGVALGVTARRHGDFLVRAAGTVIAAVGVGMLATL